MCVSRTLRFPLSSLTACSWHEVAPVISNSHDFTIESFNQDDISKQRYVPKMDSFNTKPNNSRVDPQIVMTLGMLERGLNNALETMKNSSYAIVPIHKRPELFDECCRIINAEWPASETRRLRTFGESCDEFPTCLVLLKGEKVVGHCKLSLIPSEYQSCFLGSVVIDYALRSQGLGSMLLRGAEEYAAKRSIEKIYLTTKGQEDFYRKNGYVVCPPVNIWNYIIVSSAPAITRMSNDNSVKKQFYGPPPPPMPVPPVVNSSSSSLTSSKTYMLKRL